MIFFFNDPAPTEIYTLSLHDALPILYWLARAIVGGQQAVLAILLTATVTAFSSPGLEFGPLVLARPLWAMLLWHVWQVIGQRSEEHTSELQSRLHLVCRLLLEQKKQRSPDTAVSLALANAYRDAPALAAGD